MTASSPPESAELPTEPSTDREPPPVAPYRVEVFYDGDCPLCQREIAMLKRKDRKERVRFTDIAGDGFEASDYGKTQQDLMAQIHGRSADGEWLIGVEVFRQVYTAIGLGWLVRPTRWFGVRQGLDAAYRLFAKQRLRLTGRCDAEGCGA